MRTFLHIARAVVLAAAAAMLTACGDAPEPRFQGWVEAEMLFIGPDDAGRLEALAVKEGDAIAAGAAVFTVDDDIQQADLAAAVASVAEARARLSRLEHAQQRQEEVAVLQAQERRVEAALALSTAELGRQKELSARGVAAQAQLDAANAAFSRDRAALDEVRRQIEVARLSAREEDIAAARQTLAAAEARRAAAETRFARRSVKAPAAGAVQQIYYRPGEMVPAGKPVIALLPPGNIKLRFFVPEATLPQIALGGELRVRCDGCGADLPARVTFIARTAEYTPPVIYSREERAKLVFLVEARPAKPETLRVGQPVDVLFGRGGAKQ